jgi:hypothetical protein
LEWNTLSINAFLQQLEAEGVREGQEDQLGALGLVTNNIVLRVRPSNSAFTS